MGKKNKKESIAKGQEKKLKLQDFSLDPAAEKKLKYRLAFFISIIAFIIYAHSVSFGYVYDDRTVTKQNRIVTAGVDSIGVIFKSDYWYGFSENEDMIKQDKSGVIYRPVSLVMFALEWELFPDTPAIGHLMNVLFYAATCFLLFLVLVRLFKGYHLAVPFICALLYTVHPVHTEVVSNIKSRDEIMCMFFGVLSALMFLQYYVRNQLKYVVAGAAAFFLSLLSKETGITFLVAIPLLLFFSNGFQLKKFSTNFLSLVIMTGLYFFIRAQINIGISTEGRIDFFDNTLVNANGFSERYGTAFYILLKYLAIQIFPHPLVSDYSFAQLEVKAFTDVTALFSLLIHAVAGVYALIGIRKRRLASFAILFYMVTLAPVANIFFLVGSTMAERFLYIPSLGICILITLLLVRLFKTNTVAAATQPVSNYLSSKKSLLTAAIVIAALFSLKAYFRSSDWKSDVKLFGQDVKNSPKSARLHYGYGMSMIIAIDSTKLTLPEVDAIIDEGMGEIQSALNIYPQYANAYYIIGIIQKDRKQYAAAADNILKAISYYPEKNPNFYKSLGYIYLKSGQYESSIAANDTFLAMKPATAEVLNNKGSALYEMKRYDEALSVFLNADSMKSKDSSITKNIGRCYAGLQRYDKAEEYFKKTIQLEPNNGYNYQYLGFTYQLMGDSAKANEQFIKANEILMRK